MKSTVYIQLWQYRSSEPPSESGYSLHFLRKDWETFITEFWADKPDNAPATYECPFGQPFQCQVDTETFLRVKDQGNIRIKGGGLPTGIPENFLELDAWLYAAYPRP